MKSPKQSEYTIHPPVQTKSKLSQTKAVPGAILIPV